MRISDWSSDVCSSDLVVAMADVEESSLEQFRWVNAVMSEGVFLGCKHAIPLMNKRDGGSIINMSSTGALLGYPVYLAYSAAKGAVRSMNKSVAVMRSEEHTSELQSLMHISYTVLCLTKKNI